MDETILDSVKVYKKSRDEFIDYLYKIGKVKNVKKTRKDFWRFFGQKFVELRKKGIHFHYEYFFKLYAKKLSVKEKLLPKIIKMGKSVYSIGSYPLKPHAEEVLKELKSRNYALCLYTAGKLSKLKEDKFKLFDDVFSISPKSSEKFRRIASEVLGKIAIKRKPYVVGDDLATDIRFGNELGFETIYIKGGYYIPPSEKANIIPDHRIRSLKEILEIVS